MVPPNKLGQSIWLALAWCALVSACRDPVLQAPGEESLWIGRTALILQVGDTATLDAMHKPDSNALVGRPAHATWRSSDAGIASVDASGRVRAIRPGTALVSVEVDGDRDTATVTVRDQTALSGTSWQSVSVGNETTCAVTTTGVAYCWGGGYYGARGSGSLRAFTRVMSPLRVRTNERFAQLAVGQFHACASSVTGALFCWGDNARGGAGARESGQALLLEPRVILNGVTVRGVAAGSNHSCGITSSGKAYCWGSNLFGEIGDGTAGITEFRSGPTEVRGTQQFDQIVAGEYTTCGLSTSGEAFCWGNNTWGAVGDGGPAGEATTPRRVAGDLRFRRLAAGASATCGITTTGTTYCWGINTTYPLGIDDPSPAVRLPRRVQTDLVFREIALGGATVCALDSIGGAYCWGAGAEGKLGTSAVDLPMCGTPREPCSSTPVQVDGALRFAQISVGLHATCGVTSTGELFCWGSNREGQLGIGTTRATAAVPVRVPDPIN
jgi:alpha-tubulin suppressor-like RCC1 family protein